MSFVKLTFPVLVRNLKTEDRYEYHLRPLFARQPVAHHRRFEMAVNRFNKELKYLFNGFQLDRDTASQLLWYKFNPIVDYKLHSFEFRLGKQLQKGTFGLAVFELQAITFVCLPAFNNFIFMVDAEEGQWEEILSTSEKVIVKLLKSYRKEQEDEFTLEQYLAQKGEFITTLNQSIFIKEGPFKFKRQQTAFFFNQLRNEESFDGAIEIEKVGYDLNTLYPSELKHAYFRDPLVERLYQIIYQHENTPLVLIGPEGIGKHTIVQEVVRRYIDRNIKNYEQENYLQKLWHIDPTRIIAGMMYIGWWQRRFEAILDYVQTRLRSLPNGPQLSDKLLIDNVVSILRIGRSGQNNMNLSDVLRPHLEKRRLQLILLASPEEWKIVQEKDRRFSDLFQIVRLQEPDIPTATKMVIQQRRYLENEFGCAISIQAINQLFTIQRNYLRRKALPGSVMRLLNQLAVKYKFQSIDAQEVREEFESLSGLTEQIFDTTRTFEQD